MAVKKTTTPVKPTVTKPTTVTPKPTISTPKPAPKPTVTATTRDQALSAIAKAGQDYNTAKAKGDKAGMEAAHAQANALRSANGISGDGRTTTGLEGTSYAPKPSPNPSLSTAPNTSSSYHPDRYRELGGLSAMAEAVESGNGEQYMNYIRNGGSYQPQAPVNPFMQQVQDLLKQLSQPVQTPNPLMPSFQGAQQAAQASYESKIRTALSSAEDGKQSLEDKYFQNFLNARQQMANRGLAGTGLASDQDTRLLLAKQRDLAGIYRDSMNAQLDATDWLAGRTAELSDQEQNARNQILTEHAKGLASANSDRLKTLSSFISQMMPYEKQTANEEIQTYLKGQELEANQQNNTDKLMFDKFKEIGLVQMPDGSFRPTLAATKADQEIQQKWVELFGGKPDGKGGYIFTEQARHNRATEGVAQGNLEVNQGQLKLDEKRVEEYIRDNKEKNSIAWANSAISEGNLNARIKGLEIQAEDVASKITDRTIAKQLDGHKQSLTTNQKELDRLTKEKQSLVAQKKDTTAIDKQIAGALAKVANSRDAILKITSPYLEDPADTYSADSYSGKSTSQKGGDGHNHGNEGKVAGVRGSGYGGMTKAVETEYNKLVKANPGMHFMGGFNDRNVRGGNTKSMHAYGRAFDLGGTPAQMAKAAQDATKLNNVQYVIYNRKIWDAKNGWRPYTGQHPHTDHVHVDFK